MLEIQAFAEDFNNLILFQGIEKRRGVGWRHKFEIKFQSLSSKGDIFLLKKLGSSFMKNELNEEHFFMKFVEDL